MNVWRAHKRISIWFLLPAAIILSLILTYLASNLALPSSGIRAANAQTPDLHADTQNKLILSKGEAQAVGRITMTYQGLKTGHIVINITPVHIDSGYAYRRDIPINTAEKGFWLAQQYYKLISAGRSKLEIIRIRI